jgi:hypothetical protein
VEVEEEGINNVDMDRVETATTAVRNRIETGDKGLSKLENQ